MKRKNFSMIILITVAFIAGLAVNILLRIFLPEVLPAEYVAFVEIAAILANVAVSALIVFIGAYVFRIGKR